MPGEFLIVGNQPDSLRTLGKVESVALLHVQASESFFGKDNAAGIADGYDLDCGYHIANYNKSYNLLPVVAHLAEAFVDHGIELGALLDEDLAELPILAEQDGLQAH